MQIIINSIYMLYLMVRFSEQSCEKLTQLKIWQEQQLPGGLIAFKLNENFRQNFKTALLAQ